MIRVARMEWRETEKTRSLPAGACGFRSAVNVIRRLDRKSMGSREINTISSWFMGESMSVDRSVAFYWIVHKRMRRRRWREREWMCW